MERQVTTKNCVYTIEEKTKAKKKIKNTLKIQVKMLKEDLQDANMYFKT